MKTIVITGCSTGLGRAAALHLAGSGWRVFATVRKEADRDSLLREAVARGCQEQLHAVLCDITRADEVAGLRQAVEAAAPHLDALLNNAGTGFPGPLELLPLDDLRRQLEINVVAHLAVTQALLPALRRARGMILNVSSVGGRVAYPITGPYHMSKFALEAMSDALRIEVAPFGVRVVVIEPGSSPTPIWENSLGRVTGAEVAARVGEYAPLAAAVTGAALSGARRGFPPQDFARLVERILNSRRPATRYVIPASVRFYILARKYLPDRVWDWIVRRALGW